MAYVASGRPSFYTSSLANVSQKVNYWRTSDHGDHGVTVRHTTPRGILPLAERRARACIR